MMLMQIQIPQFRPNVVQVNDDSMQRAAEFLALMLERKRERKQAKRERQYETRAEESPGAEVPEAEKDAYEAATGQKWTPGATYGGAMGALRGQQVATLNRLQGDPEIAEMIALYSSVGEATTGKALKTRGKTQEMAATAELMTTSDYLQRYVDLPEEQRQQVAFKLVTDTLPESIDLEAAQAGLEKEVVLATQNLLTEPGGAASREWFKKATGMNLGDAVGMVALGLGNLFDSYWSGQFSTRDDLEETLNNVAEDIAKNSQGRITPVQVLQIMSLKDQGYTRDKVAADKKLAGILPVWDVYEAGAQAAWSVTAGEAMRQNPYFLAMTEAIIPLMAKVGPTSEMFKEMGNFFLSMSKYGILTSQSDFAQIQQEMSSPDPATRAKAVEKLEVGLRVLDSMMPEFTRKGGWFNKYVAPVQPSEIPGEAGSLSGAALAPGVAPGGEGGVGVEELMALFELIKKQYPELADSLGVGGR